MQNIEIKKNDSARLVTHTTIFTRKNAITRKLILPTMFGKVVATPLIL